MPDPVQEDVERRRRDYVARPFALADAAPDPIAQFERWYAEAAAAGIAEPNAMTVSTVDAAGRPQARILLLRGIDERGFRFYTNLSSPKARELAARPVAALTFAWLEVHRQVRVTGPARVLDAAESDAYFATRPRGHRVGAWASPQSDVIADRAELDRRFGEAERRFEGVEDVPRPEFWGGFLVEPDVAEFWQGRLSRLHDRVRYRRDEGGGWLRERLAP